MTGRPASRYLANSVLAFATLAEVLLPFLRNVALARLLDPHNFGLAVTFSVVWGILEQVTDIGIVFSAMRHPGAAHPDRYYATLHSLAVLRASFLFIVLTALSPLCAWVFAAPEAVWAYAGLGIAASIRGFINLGIREAMRSYQYWREGTAVFLSQLFWTVLTVVAAWWLEDFNAALVGIIGNAICYVVLTHLLSPRRMRFGWDRGLVAENLTYGRPLMFNGMSNAFTQLADRFVVGMTLGVVQLGIYNVTLATAILPRNAITKFLNTLYMPGFVNLDAGRARDVRLFETWVLNLGLLGFAYGIALISIGPVVIGGIFGPAFRPTPLIMGLVAILLCTKFLIQLPVPSALAYGQTRLIFYGNAASAVGVLCSIGVLLLTRDLEHFILALTVADFAALCLIASLSISRYGSVPWLLWTYVLLPNLVLAGLLALQLTVSFTLPAWIAVSWSVGAAVIMLLVAISYAGGWRPDVISVLRRAEKAEAEAA
ncbi:oligosaccharide flippase family protein [Methylobacterium sp. ID0610]|uniref:oligosaccharide flippase family protein n=1 Tax=Methylobacterium carpenticola TaxID=3344827 RepID=UPI0036BF7835